MAAPRRPEHADPAEPASTDVSVLERAKRRDPAAWQRIIDLYGPAVGFWCAGAEI